jgi:hypothetical protein
MRVSKYRTGVLKVRDREACVQSEALNSLKFQFSRVRLSA